MRAATTLSSVSASSRLVPISPQFDSELIHTSSRSHVKMCVATAPFPRAVTRVNRSHRPTGNRREANACVIFCHRIDIKPPRAKATTRRYWLCIWSVSIIDYWRYWLCVASSDAIFLSSLRSKLLLVPFLVRLDSLYTFSFFVFCAHVCCASLKVIVLYYCIVFFTRKKKRNIGLLRRTLFSYQFVRPFVCLWRL